MKNKKICCFVLAIILLISCFAPLSFAADSSYSLLTELQSNFPGFDERAYPTGDTPVIIGAMESGSRESDTGSFLYVYLYGPSLGSLQDSNNDFAQLQGFSVYYYDESSSVCKYKYNPDIHNAVGFCSEGNFHRMSFSLPIGKAKEYYQRLYVFEKISIISFDENDANRKSIMVEGENRFIFKTNVDGTLDYNYNTKSLVTLDVKSTMYHTTSTNEKYKYDGIASVYFDVPEEYVEYYDKIYSVTSTYRKRRTNPIFISNLINPNAYGPYLPDSLSFQLLDNSPSQFEYSDIGRYSFAFGDASSVGGAVIGGESVVPVWSDFFAYNFQDTRVNIEFKSDNGYSPKIIDSFEWIFYDEDAESTFDLSVSQDEILDYYKKNYSNLLFCYTEDFTNSTKTVDDTWDSMSYGSSENIGFWDYWNDFGIVSAFKYLILDKSSNEYKEFLNENGITDTGFNFENEPYLLKVDEAMRADLEALTKTEFCDKYAIGYNEYVDFVTYVGAHDNVLLYRFDIDDYISLPGYCYEGQVVTANNVSCLCFCETYTDYAFGITQQYFYEDFQIIKLTMSDEGNYSTLGTTSKALDIVDDAEIILPSDGLPSTGKLFGVTVSFIGKKLSEFTGSLWDKIKDYLRNSTAFKVIVFVLVVIVLIVIGIGIFKVINFFQNRNRIKDISKTINELRGNNPHKKE